MFIVLGTFCPPNFYNVTYFLSACNAEDLIVWHQARVRDRSVNEMSDAQSTEWAWSQHM